MIAIRPMQAADLGVVAAAEADFNPFPWPRSQFADSLTAGHRCRIAELPGGFCGYSIFSCVADEATLLNIGVCSDVQGQGYGRQLLFEGLQALSDMAMATCFLEVRKSNHVAQHLYSSAGFETVGVRKNYYPAVDGKEDALVMSRRIN